MRQQILADLPKDLRCEMIAFINGDKTCIATIIKGRTNNLIMMPMFQ